VRFRRLLTPSPRLCLALPGISGAILNSVLIRDADGGGSSGSDTTFLPAPAPALAGWALAAALALLAVVARRRLRRP
jgi:hypothetical protein